MIDHYLELWDAVYSARSAGRMQKIRGALKQFDFYYSRLQQVEPSSGAAIAIPVFIGAGFVMGFVIRGLIG